MPPHEPLPDHIEREASLIWAHADLLQSSVSEALVRYLDGLLAMVREHNAHAPFEKIVNKYSVIGTVQLIAEEIENDIDTLTNDFIVDLLRAVEDKDEK